MSYFSDLNTAIRPIFYEERRRAIEAASRNGDLLGSELSQWCGDRDIVEAAIRENPLSLRHAPFFQGDRQLALLAVSINGLARIWISSVLRKDLEIQRIAEANLPTQLPLTGPYFSLENAPMNKIFLASRTLSKLVRDNLSIYNDVVRVKLAKQKHSSFLRDTHVTLFEGGHLLPYPIKDPLFAGYLTAMNPPSADHFLLREENSRLVMPEVGVMGKGFLEHNIDQAVIIALDFNIPFRRAMCCIEGGNCFLFMSKGERKAIIGEVSLYLSMIALEEQKYFKEKDLSTESDKEPSLDAYRMARNLDLYLTKRRPIVEENYKVYLQKKEIMRREKESNPLRQNKSTILEDNSNGMEIFGGEIGYRQLITNAVSDDEKATYLEEARRLEAKLKLTKACIAEELRVPPQNIAFVPQSVFHIDMEMSVTPKGVVILHEDQKALEFLNEIEESTNLSADEEILLQAYKKTALEGVVHFNSIREKRMQILIEHQIEFHIFPAVFRAPAFKSALNYCNGIFAQNGTTVQKTSSKGKVSSYKKTKTGAFTYITTGPSIISEAIFHNRFLELFHRVFPDFGLYHVPGMSAFVAEKNGGIHCLTFETSLNIIE